MTTDRIIHQPLQVVTPKTPLRFAIETDDANPLVDKGCFASTSFPVKLTSQPGTGESAMGLRGRAAELEQLEQKRVR